MNPSVLADLLRETVDARYRRRIDDGYCRFVGVVKGGYSILVTDYPAGEQRDTMLTLTERRSEEGIISFVVGEEKIN